MPLPKIDLPIHHITLPASKKKASFRPYVTREEKILLQAAESEDERTIIDGIKQVVNNCLLTEVDIDKLPLIDLQYFFIKLRAKSVGEIIQARYECQHNSCGNMVVIPINIDQVEPTMPQKDYSLVYVTSKIIVKLHYPTFEVMKQVGKADDSDAELRVIATCIESICEEDQVFDRFTEDEAVDFLKDLPRDAFRKVLDFFDHLPEITVGIPFNCNKCGYSTQVTLNSFSELTDFFD